jgi:hypothetical protein
MKISLVKQQLQKSDLKFLDVDPETVALPCVYDGEHFITLVHVGNDDGEAIQLFCGEFPHVSADCEHARAVLEECMTINAEHLFHKLALHAQVGGALAANSHYPGSGLDHESLAGFIWSFAGFVSDARQRIDRVMADGRTSHDLDAAIDSFVRDCVVEFGCSKLDE